MSLCLATKGKIGGAVPHATAGVICTLGRILGELSVVSELIFRRVELIKVYGRVVMERIFKRDGIDQDS